MIPAVRAPLGQAECQVCDGTACVMSIRQIEGSKLPSGGIVTFVTIGTCGVSWMKKPRS